jgi:phosphoglycolate phosphatase
MTVRCVIGKYIGSLLRFILGMAKIKGLIFDLDGTIIDNNDSYMESMLKRVGKDIGYDLGLRHAQELWYSIGALSRDEVIARWGIDPDQFWLSFNKFESLNEKLKNTYIHLDALSLKKLDMPMGIVTHTSLEHTSRLLELVGMRPYFNPIIACAEDTGYKPSPLPIIYCVMKMNLDFDEVIYIGDTASDMMAAKEAHVKSVYVNRFGRPMTVKPDYEIGSLDKLIDIIN